MFCKELVSLVHLFNGDGKCTRCLARVGNYRRKHVRNAVIIAEFYDLRVYHDELQFGRSGLVKEARDDRIDADGFSGSGSSRNEQMRHVTEVRNDVVSGNVLAYDEFNY